MLLVRRVVSSRPRLSGYFLVDGDYRSVRFHSVVNLLSNLPEMHYNPDFINSTPRTSFTIIAKAPNFEDFPILYPELLI